MWKDETSAATSGARARGKRRPSAVRGHVCGANVLGPCLDWKAVFLQGMTPGSGVAGESPNGKEILLDNAKTSSLKPPVRSALASHGLWWKVNLLKVQWPLFRPGFSASEVQYIFWQNLCSCFPGQKLNGGTQTGQVCKCEPDLSGAKLSHKTYFRKATPTDPV